MADNKETLMSKISKNVETIKESKFGTKLPSNKNKQKDFQLKELSYEQMIMGTLASLTWGEKNVNKDTKVKSLLNKPNIFELVNDINSKFDSQVSIFENIKEYSETSKEILQSIDSNLSQQIVDSTWAVIRHLNENTNKLGDRLNTEKFDALNKGIEELITKLSKNLANKFELFTNNIFIPKVNDIINAISSNDISSQIQDFVIVADSFNDLKTLNQKLIELIESEKLLVRNELEINIGTTEQVNKLIDYIKDDESVNLLNIDVNSLTQLQETLKELKELKINIYDPSCIDNIKAEIESLKRLKINLFNEDNLLDVYELVDSLKQEKINLFDTNNINDIKVLIDDINKEQINIFDINSLKDAEKIFNNISNIKFDENTKNILTEISSFLDIIAKQKFDVEKNKQVIEELTKFFGRTGQKTSIENLLNAIGNLNPNNELIQRHEVLLNAFKIIGEASKLMEGHDTKINKRFFKDLNTLLTDESYIKGLINNLNTLGETTIKDEVRKNLLVVDDFITSVSNLGNIGFIRLIKSKINIKLLRKFLLKDIKALIIDVDGFKSIRKDLSKSFESLDYLFDTISKLGDVNIKRKSKMIRNLIFIKEFLNNQLKTIIEEDIAKLASVSNDNIESINAINTVIDSVLKFGEFDDEKINKIIDSTNNLELYIEDDLTSLLNSINKKLFKDANAENILSKIENVSEVIDSINNLNALLPSLISIGKSNLKLMLLEEEMSIISNIIKKTNKFDISDRASIVMLTYLLSQTSQVFNTIGDLNQSLPLLSSIKTANAKLILLNDEISLLSKILEKFKDFNVVLAKVILQLNQNGDIFKNIKEMMDISQEHLKKIDNVIELIKKLDTLSKLAIISKLSNIGLKGISEEVDLIKTIINKFSSLNQKTIENAEKSLKLFTKLVIISAGILLLGSIIMKAVNVLDLFAFTITLGTFLGAICFIFSKFKDGFKDAMKGAQDAAKLIILSGGILILGSLITAIVDFGDIATFTLMLGVFLGGICYIFTEFLGDSLKEALDGAQDAALLIVASGAILALGSLVTKFVKWQDLVLFTVMLGVFIFAVAGTYALFSENFKRSMKGAKEFGLLIAFSGLTLILAGLLANKLDLGSLALFTLILAAFIFAITGTYALFSKNFKRAMKGAKEFGLLIAISAAVLIIGTLAVQKWIDIPSLIIFTICLAGFIFAVVGVFGLASKFIKKAMATAIAIALLTVICAGTLLIGAKFIQDNPGIIDSLLWFAGITIVYIAAMGFIMWLLGQIGLGTLLKGILAIAAIGVITYGMVYVFNEAWNAFKDINWDQLITGFKKAGLVLAAVGAAITIIGGIMYATGGVGVLVVAAGAAVMAALEALIWGIAKCMIAAASAIKSFEGINEEKVKAAIKPFGTFITEAAGAMTSLSIKQILKIKASVSSIQLMGKALSVIAKSVQEFVNLKIPIYDENGKISGYLNFNQEWLGLAAENIKEIILCIGTAIIDTYKHAQETGVGDIFDSGWFSKDTPFSRVAKSMKNVGPMLSSIADAIQDWAYLRVPVYDSRTGKQTGYKQLKDTELTKAASNIQSVLITIGAAIIGTYKYTQDDADLKDIFEPSGWFGSSPFAKVTKAMKTMGPMLESIADGIQSWADLKVPVYDSNGKVKGYKQLKDKELTDAGESIKKVLVAIGTALVTTVKGNTEIFGGDDMIHNSPAVSAAKAMKIMGETLNLTAQTIGYYAKGKFPVFDKNGKKIDEYTVNDVELILAGIKIEQILTCIGRSILNIFKDPKNKEIFQGTSSNSPALMATKSVNEMSKALDASIAAIKKLSELKLDDLHKALDPNCQTRDNIYWRIKDLLTFTINMYMLFAEPNEKYGETGGFLGLGTHNQNFAEFLNEHNPEIKEAGTSIEDFSNLLNVVINNFAKMGKTFEKSLKDIAVFGIIVPYVSITMTSINNIIKLLTSDNLINLFKSINDKQNLIIKGENSTFAALNTMLVHMIATKSLFESLGDFDLNKMIAIIQSFNNCVLELQKIGKPNEDEQISFGFKFTTNSDELIKEINSYMRVIKLYVAISEYAKNVGEEGYNILRDGILKVYGATQQIEYNGIFKQHVGELEDYIEAINSIKLDNIVKLKNLVDSMNALSQRLGNLDNLTDAIGNKLSQVLYELVVQLRKAEATIKNAHELQEKRKKLMDESISKIENIMGQHMIVEISQASNNLNTTTQVSPGSINNETVDNAPQRTDDSTVTPSQPLSNPEEKTVLTNTRKLSDKQEFKDILTFTEFKRYMEKDFLDRIKE